MRPARATLRFAAVGLSASHGRYVTLTVGLSASHGRYVTRSVRHAVGKLIQKDETLALDHAIDIARTEEDATKQIQNIRKESADAMKHFKQQTRHEPWQKTGSPSNNNTMVASVASMAGVVKVATVVSVATVVNVARVASVATVINVATVVNVAWVARVPIVATVVNVACLATVISVASVATVVNVAWVASVAEG